MHHRSEEDHGIQVGDNYCASNKYSEFIQESDFSHEQEYAGAEGGNTSA